MTRSPTANPWTDLGCRDIFENPWMRVVEHRVLRPGGDARNLRGRALDEACHRRRALHACGGDRAGRPIPFSPRALQLGDPGGRQRRGREPGRDRAARAQGGDGLQRGPARAVSRSRSVQLHQRRARDWLPRLGAHGRQSHARRDGGISAADAAVPGCLALGARGRNHRCHQRRGNSQNRGARARRAACPHRSCRGFRVKGAYLPGPCAAR